MSLALHKLQPVTVQDPRIIQQPGVYPVLKGGRDVLYKQFTTTSVSQSSINFSCPPPSQEVFVDRRVNLKCPVRLTLVGTGIPIGVFLLNPGQTCLRSYPLMKALDTIQMTINNQSMSVNISDMLSALEHFNIDRKLKAVDYTKCPTYGACQSQDFNELLGATRSPMALYGDGLDDLAPAAFPFTVVSQNNSAVAPATVGTATSVIDFVSTEPLFLSPLFWGTFDNDESAFIGVRTFDMTLNFLNQGANRMIALDNTQAPLGSGIAYTPVTWSAQMQFSNFQAPAFTYPDNQPVLLFQYITPQLDQSYGLTLNRELHYPYFNIERFPTDSNSDLAPGAAATQSSNNIQLNSIPSKMYIFVRNSNAVMNANPFKPDTFCAINNVSIQWGNKSGTLSSASQEQLYDLSVKNGCAMSWAAWSGNKLNRAPVVPGDFGKVSEQYSGTGSVLALDTLDLGLDSLDAPGKIKQLMVQVTVNYTNVAKTPVRPTLYFVAVSQGVFTIYNGQASALVGVLTSADILYSAKQTEHLNISYADLRHVNGGNFLSSLKSGLSNVWSFLKPVLKKVAPYASMIPGPVGEVASVLNPVIQGLGGAKIPRRALKNRLK